MPRKMPSGLLLLAEKTASLTPVKKSTTSSSANLYSLIETAKANGLEPYAYLKNIFTDLP
jgi:hypothetical protein